MALEVLRLEKKILSFTIGKCYYKQYYVFHQNHYHGDTMMSFIVGFASGFSAKTRGWPRAGAA